MVAQTYFKAEINGLHSLSGAMLRSLKLSRFFRLDLSSAFVRDFSIGQMVFSFHLAVTQTRI